jgi:hypothetical protein
MKHIKILLFLFACFQEVLPMDGKGPSSLFGIRYRGFFPKDSENLGMGKKA